jgi:hypothetical protein
MKSFRSINLIVLVLSITEVPVFTSKACSVEDAAKKGLIKLSIKGKGGYIGDVIEMRIQNLTNKKLDLSLEAGQILDSKKNCEQDILVTQTQNFSVIANQQKILNVWGMGCQAHNAAPQNNSDFAIGKLADSPLIKLANYIDENKKYTSYTAQQAIWTISDNNSLASISGGDKNEVNNFQNFVSKITGRTIPSYTITYTQENDNNVIGKVTKVEGTFDYTVLLSGKVTIGIYDSNGHLVQSLIQDVPHTKGKCKLHYIFKTQDLAPGAYYAKMNMNGKVEQEMEIEF